MVLSREELAGFDAWGCGAGEVYEGLHTSPDGLNDEEADRRHHVFGLNELAAKKKRGLIALFLSYFINPLILLLLTVATVSYFLDNVISAGIIYFMVLASVCITFYQEYSAQDAAEKLRKMIRNTAAVVRESVVREIPLKYLAPGDVVRLSAGDLVPADCRVVFCKDFFVNQAALTGESLPVEKTADAVKAGSPQQVVSNAVFFGSSVVSGSAIVVVVRTGNGTQFGELAQRLSRSAPETAFERGIRDYSGLMVKFVIVMVAGIFFINYFTKNDFISSALFALAVAVGLTPEMLPVIITANLSQGASRMAKKEVIVKRLPSIQNLGAMDVLCTDKTGTLTEDRIELVRHVNLDFKEDSHVLELAYLNSSYQTGLRNPLDEAVMAHDAECGKYSVAGTRKVDEIPFDFVRRRMSVVVGDKRGILMITKGSPESTLPICTHLKKKGRIVRFGPKDLERAKRAYDKLSSDGFRVLALATRRESVGKPAYKVADEAGLTFEGFLAFLDPPKASAHSSLSELIRRGIEIKILSGDNELINKKIAQIVGLQSKGVITGEEIDRATDDSLQVLVEKNTIFARVSPVQKERVILALQRNKHVVGFLGDGINDSLALKTSDVGISVDSAVDVAKESADIILLHKSLHVLYEGVDEGRRTFANAMKYLRMGSSSNFGNMFSVVGASALLPFLPMGPLQLIINNFLYDLSQLGGTADNVDAESLAKPAQWTLDNVRNYMIFIGPISSIFDYVTFGVMWFVFGAQTMAQQQLFHAGWFIESLMTQTLVVHVIRTNKVPFLESMPSDKLLLSTFGAVFIGLLLVATPLRGIFGFGELPPLFYALLVAMVVAYLVLTQFAKTALLKMGFIR